jgi:hypothetical protein
MNILILGDSFCQYDNENTWPNELRKLGHTITCIGESGCSNYVILENFRKHHNSTYDYVIVLLTSENRIPIVNGPTYLCNHIPSSAAWGNKFKLLPHDFESAVEGWFKYMYNYDFLRWTVMCGINEIESCVLPHQTIIWVESVPGDRSIINDVKTGIKVTGSLYKPSILELESCQITWPEYYSKCFALGYRRDLRKNHMISSNQVALAEFINDIIAKHRDKQLADIDLDLLNKPKWATDRDYIYPHLFVTS